MDAFKLALKNVFSLTAAELVTKLLAFILSICIARHLQDIGFGKYSFSFAFTSLFSVISDFGLGTLMVRDIARKKELAEKYFGNTFLLKFFLSIVAFMLIVVVINLMNYPYDTTLSVYLAGTYVILTSFNQFIISFFRAFEKMEYETLVRIIERITVFSLGMYVIYLGYGLIEIVSAFLFASILSLGISILILTKKIVTPKFEIDFLLIKNILKEAWPFGLTTIFSIIYFRIDTVMLSVMKSDEIVGWYNAGYNIIDGLAPLIAGSISSVAFPMMCRYHLESQKNLEKIYLQSFQSLFLIGLIISIIFTYYSDKIIISFYGPQYSNAIKVLQILMWAFFIICLRTITNTLLYSINKQKLVMIGTGIGACINILFNFVLIPRFSLYGAAFATAATEFIVFILYFYYSMKFLDIKYKDLPQIFISQTRENMKVLRNYLNY